MANVDFELQILMDQLSAMNLGTVMSEVQTSPAFRAGMIENLEARTSETLSTEEKMWLAWC